MKLYLDDIRTPPVGWTLCRWPNDVIEYLKTMKVEEISLDHDLGDDRITGYDVLTWIEREVYLNNYKPPIMKVHSANPVARERMKVLKF
jgi:hypothetical protein